MSPQETLEAGKQGILRAVALELKVASCSNASSSAGSAGSKAVLAEHAFDCLAEVTHLITHPPTLLLTNLLTVRSPG